MTAQSRTTLKAKFENGDTPPGSDYTDWLDSYLHLIDVSAQTIASPITVTTMGATTVSAATVSAQRVNASAMTVVANISAASLNLSGKLTTSSITVTGIVSGATGHFGALVMNSEVTASVSAAASAARYISIQSSGVSYWMPVYNM